MLTTDQYVERYGNACPNCEEIDIEGTGLVQTDSGIAWQTCRCGSCGAEWTDEYRLTGYSDVSLPEQEQPSA